jgi:hypothetical protein
LVLFFKKELLPSRLLSFADYPLRFDLVPNIAWAPSGGIHPLVDRSRPLVLAAYYSRIVMKCSPFAGGMEGWVAGREAFAYPR